MRPGQLDALVRAATNLGCRSEDIAEIVLAASKPEMYIQLFGEDRESATDPPLLVRVLRESLRQVAGTRFVSFGGKSISGTEHVVKAGVSLAKRCGLSATAMPTAADFDMEDRPIEDVLRDLGGYVGTFGCTLVSFDLTLSYFDPNGGMYEDHSDRYYPTTVVPSAYYREFSEVMAGILDLTNWTEAGIEQSARMAGQHAPMLIEIERWSTDPEPQTQQQLDALVRAAKYFGRSPGAIATILLAALEPEMYVQQFGEYFGEDWESTDPRLSAWALLAEVESTHVSTVWDGLGTEWVVERCMTFVDRHELLARGGGAANPTVPDFYMDPTTADFDLKDRPIEDVLRDFGRYLGTFGYTLVSFDHRWDRYYPTTVVPSKDYREFTIVMAGIFDLTNWTEMSARDN